MLTLDSQPSHPPRRVVSLVPSMTESLFDLGLGAALVGITDYCIHPARELEKLPRLGGPKNPRVNDIAALRPELVLANWEENTRQAIDGLQAEGIPVWVTCPQTVQGSLEVLRELASLFHSPEAARRVDSLEKAVERAVGAARDSQKGARYFCPIWFSRTEPWWMTFNGRTYCSDLLAVLGGDNIFARRERRYPLAADLGQEAAKDPGERDTRYPRVSLEEILAGDPQVILLPDEPYAFGEHSRQEICELLAETKAVRSGRVYLVDGSLITWHGTRLARALQELPPILRLA